MTESIRLDRTTRRLFESTASRCRGKTLVLGGDCGALGERIRERRLEVVEHDPRLAMGSPAIPVARPGSAPW